MSLFLLEKISPTTEIGIWQISDMPRQKLMDELKSSPKDNEIHTFKNEWRIKEKAGIKFLLRKMLGNDPDLFYDDKGKPFIHDSQLHISLSHSHDFVAAIIEKNHSTGIDIQKITPKILRIKEKFMNSKELEHVTGKENAVDLLHVYWGAKESIFKAYGRGNLVFADQIFIDAFNFKNKGEINAVLKLENQSISYVLDYKKFNNYMLVYVRELANIVT